jgi:hypothetical protein
MLQGQLEGVTFDGCLAGNSIVYINSIVYSMDKKRIIDMFAKTSIELSKAL